jgi:glucose/arabinose dehydrogenase
MLVRRSSNCSIEKLFLTLCLCASVSLCFTKTLFAQTPQLNLVPVLTGLSQPVLLTNAKDGSGRRFIVEQPGRVLVLQPGSDNPTLFLDITSRVLYGGERGLLGLAFHPQFAQNGRFYVNYTRQPDGATVVAEYQNGTEQRILFTVAQPYENHNGGMVEFGPDGYLYIGMGDGGSGNDPQNRAQNLNELLGKMLRINVDVSDSQPEIFAYGFRNPWRFSFDHLTGQLYVGDVGQSAREEIDIVTQGGNYGWRVWEGTACTGLGPAPCTDPGFSPPIADYANTGGDGRCAIIGGYVYRGTQASLPYGAYVYGDLCSGEIMILQDGVQTVLADTVLQITSFGEDEAGEIYVLALDGSVSHLTNPDAVNAAQLDYSVSNDHVFMVSTAGNSSSVTRGYARIRSDENQTVPSSLAILDLRRNGALVSETSVPTSPAITTGRLFVQIGQLVNTGLAIVNPNDIAASLEFYFTDESGENVGGGSLTIPAGQQIAAFLTETPFNADSTLVGTFTFMASAGLRATAFRIVTNQRGDPLITTVPVMQLRAALSGSSTTIAHFAAGGGWSTEVMLVNPSDGFITGNVQFIDSSDQTIQSRPYTITPRSSTRILADTSSGQVRTGFVRVSSPAAATGLISFTDGGVTVTQTVVPAMFESSAFLMYAETGGAVRTGIAIANPSSSVVDVTLDFAGAEAVLSIPGNSQKAIFIDELSEFSNVSSFRGALRINATGFIAVADLRFRANQRGDFLMTNIAPNEAGGSSPAETICPYFADGVGYTTQVVLFGGPASGTMYFLDQSGNPAFLMIE